MRKIVWHNATKDDLLDIVGYLKRSFGKEVAKKCLSEIKGIVNLLATFPFFLVQKMTASLIKNMPFTHFIQDLTAFYIQLGKKMS